jgi:hypothetical protein
VTDIAEKNLLLMNYRIRRKICGAYPTESDNCCNDVLRRLITADPNYPALSSISEVGADAGGEYTDNDYESINIS